MVIKTKRMKKIKIKKHKTMKRDRYNLYWHEKIGVYVMLYGEPIKGSVFLKGVNHIKRSYRVFVRPRKHKIEVERNRLRIYKKMFKKLNSSNNSTENNQSNKNN